MLENPQEYLALTEYGNIEIAVKSIRCFHKYTFRLTEKAYLSMLRNAA